MRGNAGISDGWLSGGASTSDLLGRTAAVERLVQ